MEIGTTGRTERGDQILKCNASLLSEEFIIHIHTLPDTRTHGSTHASNREEIRKDRNGEKREHGATRKWDNGNEE